MKNEFVIYRLKTNEIQIWENKNFLNIDFKILMLTLLMGDDVVYLGEL